MKTVCVKVPDVVSEYFMKNYGGLTELFEGLLNDSLKSIIQQEAKEEEDARNTPERL